MTAKARNPRASVKQTRDDRRRRQGRAAWTDRFKCRGFGRMPACKYGRGHRLSALNGSPTQGLEVPPGDSSSKYSRFDIDEEIDVAVRQASPGP